MKKQEGNWTPEELDHFLTNPRGVVPGTAMTFAGLPRGKERADVITFLNTKSDKPVELPKQAAAPAAEKQAAGGGDKPQGDGKPAAAPQQGNAPAAKAPEAPKPSEAKPPEAKPAEAPKAQ
jgi:cytochrome c